VLPEPHSDVRRDAGVIPTRIGGTVENVDEAFRSGHAAAVCKIARLESRPEIGSVSSVGTNGCGSTRRRECGKYADLDTRTTRMIRCSPPSRLRRYGGHHFRSREARAKMVDLTGAGWNRISKWLHGIEALRALA